MTKKSKMTLALASMLGITAGATAVSGFAWFTTTKSATVDITNIGVYSTSSDLDVRLKNPIKGCIDDTEHPSSRGDLNLIGGTATTPTVETFTAGATQTEYTIKQYPSAAPTVTYKVGNGDPVNATVQTWGKTSKTIELSAAPTEGALVTITYTPYAALTDISSADGKTFYKPVWTAGNQGVTATAITDVTSASTGYVSFAMTITASGSDALDVYVNNASITGVTGSAADTAAANITRVAFIVNNAASLILQKTVTNANNKGIDSTFAGTANAAPLWDLSSLDTVPSALAAIHGVDKSTWSKATGHQSKAENFVCTVAGNSSVDVTVNIWLEGTSGNESGDASGEFATAANPENGMISVSLPLIAL